MFKSDKKRKIKACKLCGKKKVDLSRRGYCKKCALKLTLNAVSQLKVKEGPLYNKWKENLSRSLEGK